MHVSIEPSKSGKTFGIAIAKEADQDPFLVIKGCRMARTGDGRDFVSGPSTKMDDGKWFQYTYMDRKFGDYITKLALEAMQTHPATKVTDIDESLPF